jgi:hypothetical protein
MLAAVELDWLNGLSRIEKNLSIVIKHEDEQRRAYIEQGIRRRISCGPLLG